MSAAQVWRTDGPRVTTRAVVLASADAGLRQRLKDGLVGLRWSVQEAGGAAEAMAQVEMGRPEALLVDGWLPDLEVVEFSAHMCSIYPGMDVLRVDGSASRSGTAGRSPRRNELLHAIRQAQESGAAEMLELPTAANMRENGAIVKDGLLPRHETAAIHIAQRTLKLEPAIEEMIGESAPMRELARMIRLVAPRSATVLIEGETGTGKEVVAKALHRLSARAGKPFVILNCAAIPESLLEAELFGHTRGAFTGAVQSRTGRIEAAHGGTLFLDEIGEMPLLLQAKMLRFLECGELQKVGENETMRVDVRVIAATHQPLEQRSEERTFRLDLYHRLAVFPLEVPPLRERMEDLPGLVEFFLEQMGREMPRKSLSSAAVKLLAGYGWPGNVRELMHVLERGAILAEERAEIGVDEIRVRGLRRP